MRTRLEKALSDKKHRDRHGGADPAQVNLLDEKACHSRVGIHFPADYSVTFKDCLTEHGEQAITDMATHARQIEAYGRSVRQILDQAQGTSSLLFKILEFRSNTALSEISRATYHTADLLRQSALRAEQSSVTSANLARQSQRDSKLVKFLSTIATFYLPVSLIATEHDLIHCSLFMGSRLEANSSAVRKRIEKHSFDNEDGEEYEPSKFGGFTDYFRRKKIKLQNLDAERRLAADKPPIFRGVVAHVNGYTQPSLNDLHNLIVEYGGGFMQYLDGKTTVTHIIAANLTPKKKVEFSKYRIVKPAWVVDSIAAGKLLPWDKYRVVDEGAGQQIIGLDNGRVTSTANTQGTRYREQTDTSWYTTQLQQFAQKVNNGGEPSHEEENFLDTQDTELLDELEKQEIKVLDPADHFAPGENVDTSDERAFVEEDSDNENPPTNLANGSVQDTDALSEQPQRVTPSVDISPAKSWLRRSSTKAKQEVDPTRRDAMGTFHADVDLPNKATMTAEEHNALLLQDPKIWKSTVVNPGFLKQYYEESRLHHLSAWKASLKSQMQALAFEKSSPQKARQKRPAGSRRYILHVDFDCFFAAVSLRKHPEWIDLPAVVAHGGGSGSEIASCNYPARAFGVKNGMWMKSAQQICPDLKIMPYDFKDYEEASRHFYTVILDIGGTVQSVSIDEALVDISTICIEAGGHDGKGVHEGSLWREQAKAEEIATKVRNEIKERTGCAVSVGIGGNILLAKVALRKAKPMAQYHVKPDDVLNFIGKLNVQDLPGVAYSIGGKLEEIGVKLVKDVRNLTKEKLINTLGPKTGEKLWEYSRGIDRTEVGEQVIRKSVSAEVNWGVRFATQEQADEFVVCLAEELHKRLLSEGVKGRQFTMKIMRRSQDSPLDPPKHLGHGKCDTFNKSVVLGVSTNAKEVLGREALSILRGLGFPPGELRGLGVQMTKLEPIKGSIEAPADASQRRLQFNTPGKFSKSRAEDLVVDEIESPEKPKPRPKSTHPASTFAAKENVDSPPRKLLNTMGTQFILPSQVDPEVLTELPADIRMKLQASKKVAPPSPPSLLAPPPKAAQEESEKEERASSAGPSVERQGNMPSLSQLDQEILDSLPDDVRAEVLATYGGGAGTDLSPVKAAIRNQTVLPQSLRKDRTIKASKKKLATPTKKRGGGLFRGRPSKKFDSNSTLTQANFVAPRDETTETAEVSADFLAALPDDIRQEILEQQRRDRLQRRGGIDVNSRNNKLRGMRGLAMPLAQDSRAAKLAQRLANIKDPERKPLPTFTTKKLTRSTDLREAVRAWYEEFREEGPYQEDEDALVRYLGKVVTDELDMAKAVGIVRWLGWIVDQEDEESEVWLATVKRIRDGVKAAGRERGLGELVI
ncbi:deoxycytidyl transferase [Agyrium rufum]|nr:deoxycytidyl transferase [Agyrium rufum]